MFNLGQYDFNPATISPPQCGSFTFTVVLANTLLPFLPEVYAVPEFPIDGRLYFEGTPFEKMLVGTYSIVIKADTEDEYFLSEPAMFEIKDPCF